LAPIDVKPMLKAMNFTSCYKLSKRHIQQCKKSLDIVFVGGEGIYEEAFYET